MAMSPNKMTALFMLRADREYLSSLNKRIYKGEKHLIPLANQQLPLVGASHKAFFAAI